MKAPVTAVRSSPLAALGVLVACLAIGSLGRRRTDEGPPPSPPTSRSTRSAERVDLNAATATELERLPRIGPALAARIVAYRDAHGPFRDVESLDAVSGIGPAIVTAVRDHVTISPLTRDGPALLTTEPPR
jgi:competence ComEA-like helix-hairpin-helix protein